MINIKSYTVPSVFLKTKFKDHNKYKKQVLDLIKKSGDNSWDNKDSYFNDKLVKTDWPKANNWERPWTKLIGQILHQELTKLAQHMGYRGIILHKLWYQRYAYGDTHNWHIHAANYTGAYFLESNKKHSTTEFLYPNDLNNSFTLEIEEGDIVFFPCSVIHRSAASKSKKNKTIISWNLDFDLIQNQFLQDKDKIDVLKEDTKNA